MTVSQDLFLTGMSVLVAALTGFTLVVAVSAMRGTGESISQLPGFRGTLRAFELSRESQASEGRWAFYLQRLSGAGVFGFLALHVVDVSVFAFSASLYNSVHRLYGSPVLRVLECGLVFAVLFHALNGLRLLAVDTLRIGLRASRYWLGVVGMLTLGAGIASSIVILAPVV